VIPASLGADAANVMRQALAGMMWTKQFYTTTSTPGSASTARSRSGRREAPRNAHWHHMENADVISMPDKWEYPWYAAWDLAFHVLALTLVDPDFGKEQLDLMLRDATCTRTARSPRTSGTSATSTRPCTPGPRSSPTAREGARGAATRVARALVPQAAAQLHLVGEPQGPHGAENAFERRFSRARQHRRVRPQSPLPTGGYLEQADGTAWMALFSQTC
jgi:hypothetical protein